MFSQTDIKDTIIDFTRNMLDDCTNIYCVYLWFWCDIQNQIFNHFCLNVILISTWLSTVRLGRDRRSTYWTRNLSMFCAIKYITPFFAERKNIFNSNLSFYRFYFLFHYFNVDRVWIEITSRMFFSKILLQKN